jgi:hypothetical protein
VNCDSRCAPATCNAALFLDPRIAFWSAFEADEVDAVPGGEGMSG